jgi:hypothetical protein
MGEATRPHLRFQQTSTPPTCRSGYGSSRLASKNVCAPAAAQDGRPKTKSLLDPVVMATQQLAGCGANRPLKSRHVPQASVFPHRLLRRRSREPTLECNANHSGRSRALCGTSGLPQTADISGPGRHFAFVQEADIAAALSIPMRGCCGARRLHAVSCSSPPPPAAARRASPSHGTALLRW